MYLTSVFLFKVAPVYGCKGMGELVSAVECSDVFRFSKHGEGEREEILGGIMGKSGEV